MAGLFGTGAQVREISQTRIQPTGIPGSTFVQAPRREAGGNLRALAEALGGLNNSLQAFATIKQQNADDPQSRANREQIARLQQMSREQLVAEIKSGSLDGQKLQLDAAEVLLSERANDDFRRAWLDYYNTDFDRTSGDAAAEYERMRQEFAAGLPSEIAKGNFYQLTGDHFRSWMEKDTEEKVAYVKQEVNTTIVDSFRNAIDDAINANGKTAQEAAEIVFTKSASNRDFLGLSGQEQNDTIFRIAQEYALKGEEDIARALLEMPRKGADGSTIPPLVKIAGYTDKALTLIEQAGNQRDQMAKENGRKIFMEVDDKVLRGAFTEADVEKLAGTGVYTDKELANKLDESKRNRLAIENRAATAQQKRALRRQSELEEAQVYSQAYSAMDSLGGIARIQDVEVSNPSGEGTRTLTKQTIIDEVVVMKEEDFEEHQETLIARGMDPETARVATNRMRVDWYAGNGLVNDEWANMLNGMAGRATTDTLLQKGEVSAYLKSSADLYRQLKAVNPAYLSTILTNKASKEFFDAYDMAVSQRRMPSDDALLYAAQWTAQPESVKAKSMVDHADAERIAASTLRSIGADPRASNHFYVMDRIATMSRNGATEREIRQRLEQEILETAVPINGMLVFANNDLPDDFPELIELELQARFEEMGARYGIEDPNDLYVVADGAESKWTVMSKSLRGPVGSAPITPRSLEAHRVRRRAEHEQLIREMARAKDAERAEYKRQYDAQIAQERARIEHWRRIANSSRRLRKSYANTIADQLQRNLDERLARDAEVLNTTPTQRNQKRKRRIRENAKRNARALGFDID